MEQSTQKYLEIPSEHAAAVFGGQDSHLRRIEKELGVAIVPRDGQVRITGPGEGVQKAESLLEQLISLAERGTEITEQNVTYGIGLTGSGQERALTEMDRDVIIHALSGRPIRPKTMGQKKYVDLIRSRMITFGIGPAGTGKTYLAMAMAIKAFRAGEVSRIILTRPAIEAGEKLGFLPGDLQSKIDPYLRPLYDALYDIMGAEAFQRNHEKGLIEVAPLAYMRGRTLDSAFIILDEAQNTTPAQMKMFLTRIGFGSRVVITGDRTQKDLPAGEVSGLDTATRILASIEEIGFAELTSSDVVRHPLVQKIVQAYEKEEQRQLRRKTTAHAARLERKREGRRE